jgi:hypothetical protein
MWVLVARGARIGYGVLEGIADQGAVLLDGAAQLLEFADPAVSGPADPPGQQFVSTCAFDSQDLPQLLCEQAGAVELGGARLEVGEGGALFGVQVGGFLPDRPHQVPVAHPGRGEGAGPDLVEGCHRPRHYVGRVQTQHRGRGFIGDDGVDRLGPVRR